MSNPVSSYTCRAMRVECPNCPRQGQQAYLSGSARRVLLFLVHLSTGTHHEQLRHATQAFGERTFPFGKPQLAPDFQPFTMRHLSIAGFTMMAPKTGTLCCVAAGKPTGRPLTEPTARCTHLIRRELLVNAIKPTLGCRVQPKYPDRRGTAGELGADKPCAVPATDAAQTSALQTRAGCTTAALAPVQCGRNPRRTSAPAVQEA